VPAAVMAAQSAAATTPRPRCAPAASLLEAEVVATTPRCRPPPTTSRSVRVHRDLHCWEGSFSWYPDGSLRGYYFKINAKLLPDLKFEKSESGVRDAFF
jgi:hypothetical protein